MIYQPQPPFERGEELRCYQVSVGHASVTVHGRDSREAVEAARTRLCDDMPRMWDVIRTLDPGRFKITEIRSSGKAST